jgi:hypothetical protein
MNLQFSIGITSNPRTGPSSTNGSGLTPRLMKLDELFAASMMTQ